MSEASKIASACWLSHHTVLVSLEKDWRSRRPPPLFWGPQKIPLTDIKLAPPIRYAEKSGYFLRGETLTFVMPGDRYAQYDWKKSGLFVAGDFNQWAGAGKRQWQLEPALVREKEYYFLSVPADRVLRKGYATCKFITGRGEWLEIWSEAPNSVTDEHGNMNLQVIGQRGGLHQFELTAPESMIESGQAVVHWIDKDFTQSVRLHPGDFLLQLSTDWPLGAIVDEAGTTFRVFAPRAKSVRVGYHLPQLREEVSYLPLQPIDTVTWEGLHPDNLHGYAYFLQIDGAPSCNFSGFVPEARILDPWALAALGPDGPGLVVDRRKLSKPAPFQTPQWQDLVIVEAHVRDLTALAPVEMSSEERLGFAGLKKCVENPDFYLRQLGANAVELQPVHEYDTRSRWDYGWGYMPVNYFAPASHYSQHPQAGSGLVEFRELVEAFHRQGMAVILDVVYNHVGEPNHLHWIDKYYWFELNREGMYLNWSGCGNDLRAGTPMARRLIVESLRFYLEYMGVDGFRFDLAELLGLETLRHIEKELKASHPSVILIAEPWSLRGHLGMALKTSGFASWNDGYRDFLKNYVLGHGNAEGLRYFLGGSLGHLTAWPSQSVNYVESHDDFCWIDRITEVHGNYGFHPTATDRRRTHLMASILFLSLGIPMISAGQDFLRSKQGVHNTYLRGDLNALAYARMTEFPATHEYFRRWIQLRMGRLGSILRLYSRPSQGYYRYFYHPHSSALGVFYNQDGTAGAHQLFYAINPHLQVSRIPLDDFSLAGWRQVADAERVEENGLTGALLGQTDYLLEMPPLSCGLWYRELAV